jgi:hypothetical protein
MANDGGFWIVALSAGGPEDFEGVPMSDADTVSRVGRKGFEPLTPCASCRCASQLRQRPVAPTPLFIEARYSTPAMTSTAPAANVPGAPQSLSWAFLNPVRTTRWPPTSPSPQSRKLPTISATPPSNNNRPPRGPSARHPGLARSARPAAEVPRRAADTAGAGTAVGAAGTAGAGTAVGAAGTAAGAVPPAVAPPAAAGRSAVASWAVSRARSSCRPAGPGGRRAAEPSAAATAGSPADPRTEVRLPTGRPRPARGPTMRALRVGLGPPLGPGVLARSVARRAAAGSQAGPQPRPLPGPLPAPRARAGAGAGVMPPGAPGLGRSVPFGPASPTVEVSLASSGDG